MRLAIPLAAHLAHRIVFSILLLPASKYAPSLVCSAPGALILNAPNVLTDIGSQMARARPTIHAMLIRTAATAHPTHSYQHQAASHF